MKYQRKCPYCGRGFSTDHYRKTYCTPEHCYQEKLQRQRREFRTKNINHLKTWKQVKKAIKTEILTTGGVWDAKKLYKVMTDKYVINKRIDLTAKVLSASMRTMVGQGLLERVGTSPAQYRVPAGYMDLGRCGVKA